MKMKKSWLMVLAAVAALTAAQRQPKEEPLMPISRRSGKYLRLVLAVVLLIAPLGASAQLVWTLPATHVTATSATLCGLVESCGEGDAAFEWGETTAYGNFTAWVRVPTTFDSYIAISNSLSSLKFNTRYHYRLVFWDQTYQDYRFGDNETFTTSIFIDTGVTHVTATGATLRGTVCANGAPVTAWFAWRDANGNSSDATNSALFQISERTNSVPVSLDITGLSGGHSYTFDLWVTNASVNVHNTQVFTTPLPATVLTLAASSITPSNATLAGAVNPNSLPTKAWFEWGTTSNYYGHTTAPVDIGSGTSNVPVSTSIAHLSDLTDYHYRLVVSNAAGVFHGANSFASTPSGRTNDGYYVVPTRLAANTRPLYPTRVTATALGNNRFPTTGDWRVRLTSNGQPLTSQMHIVNVEPTRALLDFPSMDAGFYGFLIQVSNTVRHVWEDVYESGPRFFQVGEDAEAHVYNPFPRGKWTERTQPKNFIPTASCVVTGMMSGVVGVPHQVYPYYWRFGDPIDIEVFSNAGLLYLGWTRDFPLDGEGEAGLKLGFNFPMDDVVTYTYNIPFSMILDFPTNAYAGQTMRLKARDFMFKGGTLTAHHDVDFRTYHSLWINAPYDLGFPAVVNEHSFESDRLVVWGKLPVAPGEQLAYGPWDSRDSWVRINIWTGPYAPMFDDGKITAGEIVQATVGVPSWLSDKLVHAHLTLGGQTNFTASGSSSLFSYGQHEVWTSGPYDGYQDTPEMWNGNVDILALMAVMAPSAVSAVALGLSAVGTEVDFDFGVNVRSRDAIRLKPPSTHDLTIKIPALAGGFYTINTNLSVTVDATLGSYYVYNLLGDLSFDMPCINPKNLNWARDNFWRPHVSSNVTMTATFAVNKTVEVTDRQTWMSEFVMQSPSPLEDYDLISYPPVEADEESQWVANLSFVEPPLPPMVPEVILGTFPVKPESESVVMLRSNLLAGGSVTFSPPPVDGGYATGTVVTVTAQAAPGYRFIGWSGDVTSSSTSITLTMDTVKNLTANFEWIGPLDVALTGLSYRNQVFRFDASGTADRTCVIEWSTNLAVGVWAPLVTNKTPFSITDTNAVGYPRCFYRLRLLP